MTKKYKIELNGKLIGSTDLEKADAPMGVVFGEIEFTDKNVDYNYLKNLFSKNNIELTWDYPEDKTLYTKPISNLKIINEKGIEIKGLTTEIGGIDNHKYIITVFGIAYPFYKEEFPHHVAYYKNMFGEEE